MEKLNIYIYSITPQLIIVMTTSYAFIIPYEVINIIYQYISELTRERWVGRITNHEKIDNKLSKYWSELPKIRKNVKNRALEPVAVKRIFFSGSDNVFINHNKKLFLDNLDQYKKHKICLMIMKDYKITLLE